MVYHFGNFCTSKTAKQTTFCAHFPFRERTNETIIASSLLGLPSLLLFFQAKPSYFLPPCRLYPTLCVDWRYPNMQKREQSSHVFLFVRSLFSQHGAFLLLLLPHFRESRDKIGEMKEEVQQESGVVQVDRRIVKELFFLLKSRSKSRPSVVNVLLYWYEYCTCCN